MSKYLVTEIQSFEGAMPQALTYAFSTREDADAKFFALCSTGAKTSLPKYTVMEYTDEGFELRKPEVFRHTVEPEPETSTVTDENETQ